MMKKTKWIVGLSIVGIMALSGTAFAVNSVGKTLGLEPTVATSQIQENISQPSTMNSNLGAVTTPESNGYSGGYGMMGGLGANRYGGGYGMMGGLGVNGNGSGYGMMGGQGINGYSGGYGMMGAGYDAKSLGVDLTNGEVASSDQAAEIAKAYVQIIDKNLIVSQLQEYSNVYKAEFKDGESGVKAYEIIISKNGGQIIPEMGPDRMWNTKYGHMNWGNTGAVTVTEEQATNNAQEFVSRMGQEYSIGQAELASGYYEFMVQKDGKNYTELDVNGYTGQIWFQNWWGPIIQSIDVK